ncbi:MAG: class I SAM-dependent methyltransferase [Planctomycetaceae bacterium]|nr:class I SAM-dependent methyltransferase [Planctomycetaceae bacterium]
MSFLTARWNDAKILWHLTLSRIEGETHTDRLNSFYQGQAAGYDQFRRKLLHGRAELFVQLEVPHDGIWIDLGAGTGENAELWGERISQLQKAYLVDLCQPLLDICQQRINAHQWQHVEAICADATTFRPLEKQVDLVTFSYSLTMIPDWISAINQAWQLLKPGGTLGVVDFYVSRKYPAQGRQRHSWFQQNFWPVWFANDNVFLNRDHLPYLLERFELVHLEERLGKVPYLPLVKVPYYQLIARKPE